MAYILDEVQVNNGQLIVAEDGVDVKSSGVKKTKHSAYIEGPLQVGDVGDFSKAQGTVMIGKDGNAGAEYPLYVKGNAYFDHPNIGDLSSRFDTADSKPKPFDMEHPSKGKGYRLRYACIEGPEVGVYYRGRLKNEKKIRLPDYWKDLVHTESITVQLQPIGAHQDIIVKRWDDEYVYLQAQGGLPINCFYHVYAERKDVNALVVEYEGESWSDYPDPSYDDSQFSNKVNTRTA
tara:strand:+ start:115 stop:816 length:702 start_codon:yes stop_codon:yes gene_type:complete